MFWSGIFGRWFLFIDYFLRFLDFLDLVYVYLPFQTGKTSSNQFVFVMEDFNSVKCYISFPLDTKRLGNYIFWHRFISHGVFMSFSLAIKDAINLYGWFVIIFDFKLESFVVELQTIFMKILKIFIYNIQLLKVIVTKLEEVTADMTFVFSSFLLI